MTDLIKTEPSNEACIYITHVNVRQSLSILLVRIALIQVIFSFTLVGSCRVLSCSSSFQVFDITTMSASFVQLAFILFVLYQWMYEFYEISPRGITHRKGLIYETHQEHLFEHFVSAGIEQGLWGRLLNFGTVKLYNKDIQKYFSMYLIHNPRKYYNLIRKIKPSLDEETRIVREHIVSKDKEF